MGPFGKIHPGAPVRDFKLGMCDWIPRLEQLEKVPDNVFGQAAILFHNEQLQRQHDSACNCNARKDFQGNTIGRTMLFNFQIRD